MHERDAATEKEFETALQMTLKHFLTQRFNQNTKWTAKIILANTCKCYKTKKLLFKNISA